MRSDAFINITCDVCSGYDTEILLTAIVRNGYDERNVNHDLERMGWCVDAGMDVCPDCVEERKEKGNV